MIKREIYMAKIRPFIDKELVKVMTGIRRGGKSVMLDLIKEELSVRGVKPEQMISYNFEKLGLEHLKTALALHADVLEKAAAVNGKVYLFFDEIQEVKDWEKCINSLRIDLDCDIYITGSNAKLLSTELTTYLGGRYVEFVIYPFSFGEYLQVYTRQNPEANTAQAFQSYLTGGGMPYLYNLNFEQEPCRQYLTDLFSSVVLKDIVKRHNVRDVDLLERIIAYVVANIGNTFSASSIAKFLKNEKRTVSNETVLNYISYCVDAFLFYQVKREDLQGKQILSTNEKYYMADHGIRQAVYGGNMRDINLILENIVYMELLRRGYSVTVGRNSEKEVDFVCEKQGDRLYIQVAYLLASEETADREFGAFKNIPDNYPKYVLSMDEFSMGRNGIKHMNIRDFLLSDNWN
ncbi:MAG: ATP-binding protein [Oscillospiraceae bacterium]|nr:ATP-binding protein [Oscillospiraceae bacterium]